MKLKVFSVLVCAACAGNAASREDSTPSRRGDFSWEDTRVLLTSKHGHPAVYFDGRPGKGMTLATLMSFGLTGPQAREFMGMNNEERLQYLQEHARMFGRNLDIRALGSRGYEEGEGDEGPSRGDFSQEDTRVLLTSKQGHPMVYCDGRPGKGMTLATLMAFGLTGPEARDIMHMDIRDRFNYVFFNQEKFGNHYFGAPRLYEE